MDMHATHTHTHTHTHTQGGAAAQVEEIKRVVELNVKNVVEFEIDRHQIKKTVTQKEHNPTGDSNTLSN